MKPETLMEWVLPKLPVLLPRELGSNDKRALAFRIMESLGILDATVYRSCPECGGSRKHQLCKGVGRYDKGDVGDTQSARCYGCKGTGICPACADSPTAIVEVALRERAIDAAYEAFMRPEDADVSDLVDAVLSVVLPRVRWAKEVLALAADVALETEEDGFLVIVHAESEQRLAVLEEEPH